jgi:CRISPR-associated protein Csd2
MSASHTNVQRRHDFVLLFDVLDGNPNGDPDAGNLPRVDMETMHGLVTDVCLKRKIRNWIATYGDLMAENSEEAKRLKLFIKHHGVLNDQIREAYLAEGLPVGQPVEETVSDSKTLESLRQIRELLPSSFTLSEEDDDNNNPVTKLRYSGELDASELDEQLQDAKSSPGWKTVEKLVKDLIKNAGKPKKSLQNTEKAKQWMCANFFDVRMFGAVMSSGLNAGQVRGPMQLTFSRSIDPVFPEDLAITRMAVTNANDRDKLQTIGRKTKISYGLYRGYGFFSAPLAKQTGVTNRDLELFWEAIQGMFEVVDRSASRGLMAVRGLYIFSHDNPLGNAPAHKLFDRISVQKRPEVDTPRSFDHYVIELDETNLPQGVTLTKLIEG